MRGGAIGCGLLAAGVSVLGALVLAMFVFAGGNRAPAVMTTTLIVSLAALGCGLGLPLAVAGWHSLQRKASPRLHLPPIWLLVLLFGACLGLGTLVLRAWIASALLVPPLHIVASALPALIVAAAVLPALQAGGAGLTRRNLVAMLAFGGLAATSVAIVLEGGAALAALSMAAGFMAILPGGQQAMQQLSLHLQSPAVLADPAQLSSVFVSPALILGVGLLVAIVVPLIEETVKSLGAWMEGSTLGYLNRSQAFAFGVMAGIGFSLAEALFYGTMGLPNAWASSVLVRGSTAVIHATATGLVALGWYEVWCGRARRFALYAGAGIGLHAVWNGLAGLSATAGLRIFGDGPVAQAADTALASLGTGLLVVTLMGAIALLAALTVRLRQGGSSST